MWDASTAAFNPFLHLLALYTTLPTPPGASRCPPHPPPLTPPGHEMAAGGPRRPPAAILCAAPQGAPGPQRFR